MIKLVCFLEDTFVIRIDAHEVLQGPLDTIAGIVELVTTRQAS